MKQKLLIAFTFVVLSLVGVFIWRLDAYLIQNKNLEAETMLRNQMPTNVHTAQVELRSLQQSLLQVFSRVAVAANSSSGANAASSTVTANSIKNFDKFLYVAQLELIGEGWNLKAAAFPDSSPFRLLNEASLRTNLKYLNLSSLKNGQSQLQVFSRYEGHTYLAFAVPVQIKSEAVSAATNFSGVNMQAALAILPAEALLGWFDQVKGSQVQMALITDSGFSVAHTVSDYVGTSMADQPAVSDYLRNRTSSGVSRAAGVFSTFEALPQTNLFLLLQIPVVSLAGDRVTTLWQFGLLGLGLALLSIFLASYLLGILLKDAPTTKSATGGAPLQSNLGASATAAGALTGSTAASDVAMATAAQISQEVRAPLAAVLGQVQMAEAKTKDPAVRAHLREISQIVTPTHDLVNQLARQAENVDKTARTNLAEVVNEVLSQMSIKLQHEGVLMQVDLSGIEGEQVCIDRASLKEVLQNILQNAREAMNAVLAKKITITAERSLADIVLRVQDVGEGISKENLAKIYDPMFTTRSDQGHLGMGLSMTQTFLKKVGGRIEVRSKVGDGTEVVLHIPRDMQPSAVATPSENLIDDDIFSPDSAAAQVLSDLKKEASANSKIEFATEGVEMDEKKKSPESKKEVRVGEILTISPNFDLHFLDDEVVSDSQSTEDFDQSATLVPPPVPSAAPPSAQSTTSSFASTTKLTAKPIDQDIEALFSLPPTPVEDIGMTPPELPQDVPRQSKANLPKFALSTQMSERVEKADKLDEYKTEIRKPGAKLNSKSEQDIPQGAE